MTTTQLIAQLTRILHGEHPSYTGDRLVNAESYLGEYTRANQADAKDAFYDIRWNLEMYSENSGLSPERLVWAAEIMRRIIKLKPGVF